MLFISKLFSKIPSKFFLYAIPFLIGVLVSILSYNNGYNTAKNKFTNQAKTEKIIEYKDKLQTITKEVRVAEEVEKKIYIADLTQVRKLEAENQALKNKIETLKNKVETYVPEKNVGDYLTIGAVSLHNNAADPNYAANYSTEAQAAAIALSENTAASALSWRQFTKAEIDLRGQYNKARNQCNALIDWVETNIVNDPAIDK